MDSIDKQLVCEIDCHTRPKKCLQSLVLFALIHLLYCSSWNILLKCLITDTCMFFIAIILNPARWASLIYAQLNQEFIIDC